ncbi:MAG: HAMP domain-containing protein [Deltaproteobacteria bacterium]|nr:HAMP domain-containing protein [Deltaproteobacteria bacterium]
MKIVHKIILANTFNILLIALTGFFAYENLNLLLTKLRYVEIADDLNASFLEMRLSEKNYFLYRDASALSDIQNKLNQSKEAMESDRDDIVRAIGATNYKQLESSTHAYLQVISSANSKAPTSDELQSHIREAGQKLREFSDHITKLERTNVNRIIADSRAGLFTSLFLILFSALGVNQLISRRILASLKDIEKVAHAISEGNFNKVKTSIQAEESGLLMKTLSGMRWFSFFQSNPSDELGSAMKAINAMSEDLKKHEELIIQSKKLASIGILTAGVAHELGNPLNNISMMAQAYAELYDDLSREDRLDYMKKVDEETERIKDIVKNLLDFSKPKKPNRKETHINEVVQKSLKLVQNMISISNIEINIRLEDGLPAVFIDINQIQEVLINLITNAIQAASPGTELRIATRPGTDPDHVEIEVKDTGKGIPPEFLPHVFDPFFTTKEASGTGLGLFVSYGIIQNHQGNIRVQSELGMGTCFTIELPAYNEKETRDEWS